MEYAYKSYEIDIEKLQRLEKRYSSLMKKSFNAGLKNRAYSDELNSKALELRKEIHILRSELLTDA
jgi:hypothetical protein